MVGLHGLVGSVICFFDCIYAGVYPCHFGRNIQALIETIHTMGYLVRACALPPFGADPSRSTHDLAMPARLRRVPHSRMR